MRENRVFLHTSNGEEDSSAQIEYLDKEEEADDQATQGFIDFIQPRIECAKRGEFSKRSVMDIMDAVNREFQ